MKIRSFYDKKSRHQAHFVMCTDTREAAIVDPIEVDLDRYAAHAETQRAHIACALHTRAHSEKDAILDRFAGTFGAPSHSPAMPLQAPPKDAVRVGCVIALGALSIRVTATMPTITADVAYRIDDALFSSFGLLRGEFVTSGEIAGTTDLAKHVAYDLKRLGADGHLTGREQDLVDSYIASLATRTRPPTAQELANMNPGMDRGAVHVLVHGIRRKQVALSQLPLMLHGQMTKWLGGLGGEPEWTPHEREFIAAYLAFVAENARVPSGREMLERLAHRDSIQWIRKRAHTIRRKQAAYGRPQLEMRRSRG